MMVVRRDAREHVLWPPLQILETEAATLCDTCIQNNASNQECHCQIPEYETNLGPIHRNKLSAPRRAGTDVVVEAML